MAESSKTLQIRPHVYARKEPEFVSRILRVVHYAADQMKIPFAAVRWHLVTREKNQYAVVVSGDIQTPEGIAKREVELDVPAM